MTAAPAVEVPDNKETEVPLEGLGDAIVLTALQDPPGKVPEGVRTRSMGRQGKGKAEDSFPPTPRRTRTGKRIGHPGLNPNPDLSLTLDLLCVTDLC